MGSFRRVAFSFLVIMGGQWSGKLSAQQILGNFTNTDAFEWPKVNWLRDLGANWDEGIIKTQSNTNGIARQGFGIHLNQNRQFTFWSTGLDPLLSIEGGSGNAYVKGRLGIGTTNPGGKLEVQQQNSGWTVVSKVNAPNPGEINGLKFYSGYIGEDKWSGIASVSEEVHSNKTGLSIYTNQSEKMRISADGNVGIGVFAPSDRLSVNGRVRANEIRVNGIGQPDYVFEEGYQRMSLRDLERYIKVFKHLPEVPSASEAARDGIELGEMNRLLLKKIEELTLHLIEKDKVIVAIQERLLKLEKKIKNE